MFCSVSFSSCLSRTPWTFQRSGLVVVCSKKKPPNNGYPGRGRRPRRNYSKDSEDEIDISLLYEANSVTEIPRGFVVDCAKHINNCIKRHNMQEAQEVFDLMIEKRLYPDVVTYTTLMKGYSEAGDSQMVYKLFRDLEKNGLKPTEITFSTIIRACANNGDLQRALILFDKMKNRYWLTPDDYIFNALLNVCARARDLETAKNILEEMASSDERYDAVTLATMIDVYAECCNKGNARQYLKECRDLLKEMDSKGVKTNRRALTTLLKLCARGSLTMEAMNILNEMTIKNLHPNCISYSSVIDGITKDETLSDKEVMLLSKEVVHRMKQENVPFDAGFYNGLISIALRIEDLNKAVDLFSEMKSRGLKPDAIGYGIMIKCYEKLGNPSTGDAYLRPCLDLWRECEREGKKLDGPGCVSLLSACGNASNLVVALEIWKRIEEQGIERTTSMYNAMVNVYVSVEDLTGAVHLFSKMKREGITPTGVSYSIMIKCYEKLGDPSIGDAYLKPCLDLLKECALSGTEMSLEGYTSLLSACADAANLDIALEIWNKIDKAFDLFGEMKTSGAEPNEVTYTTIITHLTKKKNRSEARKILDEMKTLGMQPDKNTLRRLKALELD